MPSFAEQLRTADMADAMQAAAEKQTSVQPETTEADEREPASVPEMRPSDQEQSNPERKEEIKRTGQFDMFRYAIMEVRAEARRLTRAAITQTVVETPEAELDWAEVHRNGKKWFAAQQRLIRDESKQRVDINRQEMKMANRFLGVPTARLAEVLEMAHEITERSTDINFEYNVRTANNAVLKQETTPGFKLINNRKVVVSSSPGQKFETRYLKVDHEQIATLSEEYAKRYKLNKTQQDALELFMEMTPEEREEASKILAQFTVTAEPVIEGNELESDSSDSNDETEASEQNAEQAPEPGAEDEPETQADDELKKEIESEEGKLLLIGNANAARLEALLIMRRIGKVKMDKLEDLVGAYKPEDADTRASWYFNAAESAKDEKELEQAIDRHMGELAYKHRYQFIRRFDSLHAQEGYLMGKLVFRDLFRNQPPTQEEIEQLGSGLRLAYRADYNTPKKRAFTEEEVQSEPGDRTESQLNVQLKQKLNNFWARVLEGQEKPEERGRHRRHEAAEGELSKVGRATRKLAQQATEKYDERYNQFVDEREREKLRQHLES